MTSVRKWLLRSLFALLVLMLVLLGAGLFLLGTQTGRSYTASLIERLGSSETMTIELDGLDSVLGDLRLARLALSDPDGTWLEARDLSIAYSLSDLLALRLTSDHVTLGSLDIARAPLPGAPNPEPEAGPIIPDIPALRAAIERIAIDHIHLGAPLLGTEASLSLSGHLSLEDSPLRVEGALTVAHLHGENGGIDAQWDFVPSENRRQISLDLNEPRGGLAARLLNMETLPAITLSLKGDGPTSDWRSTLKVAIDGQQTVSGQLAANLADGARRIEATLNGQLAPFAPPQLVPLVAGTSDLDFTLEQTSEAQLTLHEMSFVSALAELTAQGSFNLDENSSDLSATFSLGEEGTELAIEQADGPNLRFGATRASVQIKGPLDDAALDVRANIASLAQGDLSLGQTALALTSEAFDLNMLTGPVNGSLVLDDVASGSDPVDKITRGRVVLGLEGSLAGQEITLADLTLEAGLLTGRIEGTASAAALELEGTMALADLAPVNPQLAGALEGAFSVSGAPASPDVTATITGDQLAVAQKTIEDLSLSLEADAQQNASVSLDARYDGKPLTITTDMTTMEDGSRRFSNIAFTAPGSDVKGDVTLSPKGLAKGTLGADIRDLAELGPLLLQPDLSGSLTASITLSERDGQQAVNVEARAPDLAQGTNRLNNAVLRAQLMDPAGTMTIDAVLDVDSLTAGGESIKDLTASINGTQGDLPFKASATVSGAPFSLAGQFEQQTEQSVVTLDSLDGSWSRINLGLRQPARIVIADDIRIAEPLVITIDGGTARLEGGVNEQLDLTLTLQNLPLSIADKVAATGEAVSGQLALTARITGAPDAPVVTWKGDASGIAANSLRKAGAPALDVATSGRFADNQVSLQNVLTGGGSRLTLDGKVGLAGPTLNLRSEGTLPFSLLARTLADAGLRLDGEAGVKASITGNASSPQINGTLSTNGARFIELSSGIVIDDLSGTIRLDGQTAQLDGIRGSLGRDGTLTIDGTVSMDAERQMPADIHLTVDNGRFNQDTLISTVFDADLTLSGQLASNSQLSGRVDLDTTEIAIPETLPNSLSPVDVQHKNASSRVAAQAEQINPGGGDASGGAGPSIGLDVTIASPRRIYVRGRGMDAELGGTIRLAGTTANPNPIGTVSMQRGRIDLLTKRLDFDTGSITFAGTLDPALNFAATTSNSGGIYTLGVSGYASSPQINLTSSPSMPEDEILAHLFFDRNLSDLSAIQIAQLANAVATLSGVNSGPGVLDRLRGLAGIDNLDIQSDEETGETTIGAGRYLNDRTYVNVEKGTSDSSGKVSIDLQITDQLKARGEADSEGNSKAGLFFERDY